jgi:hypothetical protein
MHFETKSGMGQVCLLSPLLFLVDKVLRVSLDGKARGIRWKLTETLEALYHANDICLHVTPDIDFKSVALQALTNLGRLSSRRWQSFPTAQDGTELTCGQHIESHSCIFSFLNRTVTSLFK